MSMNIFAIVAQVSDAALEHAADADELINWEKEVAVQAWHRRLRMEGAGAIGDPLVEIIDNPTYLHRIAVDEETGEDIIDHTKLIIRVSGWATLP